MKKSALYLLTSLAFSGMLVGCAGNKTDDNQNTQKKETPVCSENLTRNFNALRDGLPGAADDDAKLALIDACLIHFGKKEVCTLKPTQGDAVELKVDEDLTAQLKAVNVLPCSDEMTKDFNALGKLFHDGVTDFAVLDPAAAQAYKHYDVALNCFFAPTYKDGAQRVTAQVLDAAFAEVDKHDPSKKVPTPGGSTSTSPTASPKGTRKPPTGGSASGSPSASVSVSTATSASNSGASTPRDSAADASGSVSGMAGLSAANSDVLPKPAFRGPAVASTDASAALLASGGVSASPRHFSAPNSPVTGAKDIHGTNSAPTSPVAGRPQTLGTGLNLGLASSTFPTRGTEPDLFLPLQYADLTSSSGENSPRDFADAEDFGDLPAVEDVPAAGGKNEASSSVASQEPKTLSGAATSAEAVAKLGATAPEADEAQVCSPEMNLALNRLWAAQMDPSVTYKALKPLLEEAKKYVPEGSQGEWLYTPENQKSMVVSAKSFLATFAQIDARKPCPKDLQAAIQNVVDRLAPHKDKPLFADMLKIRIAALGPKCTDTQGEIVDIEATLHEIFEALK